jgi:RNA polymerase sigma-70 factor (ECF subfamily)
LDSDEKLMIRFSKGDEGAFAELFDRYQDKIFRFAFRFCQDEESAADMTQETFLRIYGAGKRYKAEAKFSTYVYRVASNLCLNELRYQQRHPTVKLKEDEDRKSRREQGVEAVSADANPMEKLMQKEMARDVKIAIGKLPEKQRIAVILKRYQDMSYDEIGRVIGCSAGAVDGLLQRARVSLVKHLNEYKKG